MKKCGSAALRWPVTCLVLLSFLFGAISGGCGQSPAFDAALGSDAWQQALEKWLTLAYVEDEDEAYFGNVGCGFLSPDLYTTYAAVGIMSTAGREIDDPDETVEWVNSLQTQEGCYRDPNTSAPALFQTYWAAATLRNLGRAPANPEAIKMYVDAQQQENGLFCFSELSTAGSLEEYLGPTLVAIETLRVSGLWRDEMRLELRSAMQPVCAYATAGLSGEESGLSSDQVSYLTLALLIMEQVDPGVLPAQSEDWVSAALDRVASLYSSPTSVSGINRLLDLAMAIGGVSETKEEVPPSVRDGISGSLLPEVSELCGGFSSGSPSTLEPMLTYELVKLTTRCGMRYQYLQTLVDALAEHRLEDGWCRFASYRPSSEATFRALALARRVGCEDLFDQGKLKNALLASLDQVEASDDPRDVYFAVSAYEFAGGKLPSVIKGDLISWTGQRLEALPAGDDDGGCFGEARSLVVLGDKLGWHADETWSQSLGIIAEELNAHMPYLGVDDLYSLYVLDEASTVDQSLPHTEAILGALAALRMDQGLFRCNAESPIPDLDSTCRAVSLMQHLGSGGVTDGGAVADFVETCRMDWGFSIAPADVLAQLGEDAYSDLLLTYEALWLLDCCRGDGTSLPEMFSI